MSCCSRSNGKLSQVNCKRSPTIRIYAHTHAHTRAHIHTHAHTRAHTHTYIYNLFIIVELFPTAWVIAHHRHEKKLETRESY